MTPSFGERLVTLLGQTSVANLVGARIYPLIDRAGLAKSKVIYTVINGSPVLEAGGATAGLTEIRATLDCYAVTYDAVQELAAAVRAAFATQTDVRTLCGFVSGSTDGYDDKAPAPFRVSVDLTLTAQEN